MCLRRGAMSQTAGWLLVAWNDLMSRADVASVCWLEPPSLANTNQRGA